MIPRSREILTKLEGEKGTEPTKVVEVLVQERMFRFNDGGEPLVIYLHAGDSCEELTNGDFLINRNGEGITVYKAHLCWRSGRTLKMNVPEPAYIPPAATSGP